MSDKKIPEAVETLLGTGPRRRSRYLSLERSFRRAAAVQGFLDDALSQDGGGYCIVFTREPPHVALEGNDPEQSSGHTG